MLTLITEAECFSVTRHVLDDLRPSNGAKDDWLLIAGLAAPPLQFGFYMYLASPLLTANVLIVHQSTFVTEIRPRVSESVRRRGVNPSNLS